MTLIDYFNAFQVHSSVKGLSASARSLYFAILGEFNRLQYPAILPLSNVYLQHLSGIHSTSMFDSARNALINAKVITCSKQVYGLVEISLEDVRKGYETTSKETRKVSEIIPKDSSLVTIPKNNKEKEKNKEKNKEVEQENTTTTASTLNAPTRGNNLNSLKVQEMWFKCEGCEIPGGVAFGLQDLEKTYGEDSVAQAILTASQANTREKLSYPFVKKILENQTKGAFKNGRDDGGRNCGDRRIESESWEHERPAWLDE